MLPRGDVSFLLICETRVPRESFLNLAPPRLDQIGNVGRKLLNDRVVEALDVLEHPLIVADDKVDGHPLATESTGSSDTMEVVLGLRGQVVVDHQGHL